MCMSQWTVHTVRQLLEWVRDSWKQGVNVSSGMIRDKARELSERDDFKASLGWYVKWQKRHNVDLKEQTCGSLNDEKSSPLKLRPLHIVITSRFPMNQTSQHRVLCIKACRIYLKLGEL